MLIPLIYCILFYVKILGGINSKNVLVTYNYKVLAEKGKLMMILVAVLLQGI